MAEANQVVLKVLNHLNSKIGTGGVVESGFSPDGNSFYRKYSDGFIEQGGFVEQEPTGKRVITFTIPFASKVMSVSRVNVTTSTNQNNGTDGFSVYNVTTVSFSLSFVGYDGYWYACGY